MYTFSTKSWDFFSRRLISISLSALSAFCESGSMGIDIPPTRKVCGWGFLLPRMAWILMTSFCHSNASR